MRLLSILLALASACASGKTSTAPAATAGRAPVPLEEYYKIRRYGGTNMTFSHGGELVVFGSDQGGRTALWARPVAGGEPRRISHLQGFLGGFASHTTEDVVSEQ